MKFINKSSTGEFQLVDAISSFTGIANQVVGTNSSGLIDPSIIPLPENAAAVKAVRNSNLTLTGSWADITFDTTAIETDDTILNHDNSVRDNFITVEGGLYLFLFQARSEGESEVRLVKNGGTVVSGTFNEVDVPTDIIPIGFMTLDIASDGDTYTIQAQENGGGTNTLLNPASIQIIKLDGLKGPAGSDGAAGEAGPAGFGIFGVSVTNANATQSSSSNLTVTSGGTGIYNYSFINNANAADYAVVPSHVDNASVNAVEFQIQNKTTSGFTLRVNTQDDGGGSGSNTNAAHDVAVISTSQGLGDVSILDLTDVSGTPANGQPLIYKSSSQSFEPDNSLVIDNDGTITVGNQSNYEAKITSNNDLLTLKFLSDRLAEAYVETNGTSDNAINYNQTTATKVAFSGTSFTNSSLILFSSTNNSFDTSFTGQVEVKCLLNVVSNGTRNHITPQIVRDSGGTLTIKTVRATYIRSTTGHNNDSLLGSQFFDCQPGDRFFIRTIRQGLNTTATNLNDISNFTIRRIG